ncbi:MAG TPA: hypothetical protein PLN21_04905 [Gemmatales bacterium]|nr:hypothetical protein [Gemmatales bacterium]
MSQLWKRQSIADSPLSVIVLMEQFDVDALRQTLTDLQPVLQETGKTCEVLVPSPTSAETALEPALAVCSSARLVSSDDVSQGQGAALKVGIAAAKHPLVFVLPTGYAAKYLPAFLKEIDLVDLVCGTRESKASGWKRRQFFSVAYQLFGLWMQDPECPMRLYRREMFDRIPIQSTGSFAQIEILAKANFESKLMTDVAIEGPSHDLARNSKDFWKVLNSPNFGKPPEKVVEAPVKSIIETAAPEARA